LLVKCWSDAVCPVRPNTFCHIPRLAKCFLLLVKAGDGRPGSRQLAARLARAVLLISFYHSMVAVTLGIRNDVLSDAWKACTDALRHTFTPTHSQLTFTPTHSQVTFAPTHSRTHVCTRCILTYSRTGDERSNNRVEFEGVSGDDGTWRVLIDAHQGGKTKYTVSSLRCGRCVCVCVRACARGRSA
jgi:hypothetical protein